MLTVTESEIQRARPVTLKRLPATGMPVKRVLDVALSLLALFFFAPAFLAIAIALLIADGSPVIYRHKRIGANGRSFECLKFRSMRKDAAERLEEVLAADPVARREWNESQKLKDDPRIHRLGKFLRISSLDELPQFVNVLRGDMSLVGPRPIVADEMERYGEHIHYYLAMKPGITGLWQVSGRNDTSYENRVRFDVEYYRKRGLLFDMRIMVKTVGVVLFTRNGW